VSDLDLTEAVEAAARAAADHPAFTGNARPNDGMTMWDSLRPEVQYLLRELVLPLVTAAAPFIEAQVGLVCAESCAGQSWTGVDQAEGPDKVWRCDTCGRIVGQNVSNPS